MSKYQKPKGKQVGGNLQTIPDDYDFDFDHPLAQGMRDLFIADEGHLLAKCDLKGADGWTIGAYMANLGDRTMLDDLKFGLKPAQVVAHTLLHGPGPVMEAGHDRAQLKALCATVPKESWQYFVSKQLIWGAFYTMGPRKAAESVFLQSDGKVHFTERQAKDFFASVQVRYKFRRYQNYFEDMLTRQGYPASVVCPDGSIRKFWGRNKFGRCEILGEALAHVPQSVTTYAIKLALHKLWFDPDNWPGTGVPDVTARPRVEPMHTVHDELVMQFRREDLDWFKVKVRQWFDNTIIVANQAIVIPFDGAVGTAWSMDSTHKVESL